MVPYRVGADGVVSLVDQPLARYTARHIEPRRLAVPGALVIGAILLIALRPELAGWMIFGVLALASGIVEPLLPLLLLPFAVAFGSLVSLDAHGLHIGPTDVLVLALMAGVAARVLRTPGWERWSIDRRLIQRAWHEHRLVVGVFLTLAAYLAVICLSLIVASSHVGTLKEVVKWSEVLAVTAVTLWLVRTPGRLRLVIWALIAAGVAEALLGYGQWVFATGDLGPGGASIRVFGTFAQPNPFAAYLNFALPLALALAIFGMDARERWVAGAASVLLLGAQALADSRGGLLGLAAAVVVLIVVGWRKERLAGWALLISVPVAAVAWFVHLIPARIEDALLRQFRLGDLAPGGQVTPSNYSTAERLAHWLAGLRMFQAHPLLGVGAGNYNAAYAQFGLPDWPEPLGQAHNYYINVAAETGLLGLVAFLALVAVMLYLGWRVAHAAVLAKEAARALALGLLAVLVALTVHNLTDDLFVHGMELQVALCIGCLLALRANKQGAV